MNNSSAFPLTWPLYRALINAVDSSYTLLFRTFSFITGAMIGSFLNVVVYRLPLGLSVNDPRRSFCPNCKKQIPFYRNLPLISWLQLQGKCAECGKAIAFRYFGVELLTATLFLLIYLQCDQLGAWSMILPLWVFVSLLVSATFIDFDHFIIPDEITLGGTATGLLASLAVPSLMGADSPWIGLLWSAIGAASGYGLLWGVVEAGKLAFGKRKLTFDPPAEFRWVRQEDDADFTVGEDRMRWSEVFSRESDQLVMEVQETRVDEQSLDELAGEPAAQPQKASTQQTLKFFYNRLVLPAREIPLESLASIAGKVRTLVIPREAMGFGDVKFIACIGAFLGWKAVLFTIIAASVFGSLVGVTMILIGRREASGRIPFGPYLALGALLWIFTGPALVHWYLAQLQNPSESGLN
ncbi:MAG: prepilin peptidase [Verrucomicrobiota bacterium]